MSKIILSVLITLLVSSSVVAKNQEHFVRFTMPDKTELNEISRLISISSVHGDTVYAYITSDRLKSLSNTLPELTELEHPGARIIPDMAASVSGLADWDTYPTYPQYDSIMHQFAADFPAICVIDTIGYSVQGRLLLAVKISDSVTIEEDEPEVFYTSTIHGDETTGYVLMLRLIDSLLVSYGSDSAITNMIDSMEIWINPLANPDGTYRISDFTVNGAIRANYNLVDLNRNYPDPEDGANPDGKSWQPETTAMMNFASAHSFVLSANFHGGSEVINYPWDTWSRFHADDAWFMYISRLYADTAQTFSPSGYLDDLNDGITNGYAWYTISGGRQDYMNYFEQCREVTMEISQTKLVNSALLPSYWEYNKRSLFRYLQNARYGIRGIVTDSITGEPLFAEIEISNYDSDLDRSTVYTDPDIGDYHRLLLPGTYDLIITADGYIPKTINAVTVHDLSAIRLDVPLHNDTGAVFICGDIDNSGGSTDISDALYLIEYLFDSPAGPPPPVMSSADVDGLSGVTISDLMYLLDYMFFYGPALLCP